LLACEFIIIFFVNNYLFLTMHSNVTIKNVSWPHFSWATLYFFVIDEASDFKFGRQLRFAKAHPPSNSTKRKSRYGPGLGDLPEREASPLILLQRLKLDFKLGTQLRFAKTHHKITPRRKMGVALG